MFSIFHASQVAPIHPSINFQSCTSCVLSNSCRVKHAALTATSLSVRADFEHLNSRWLKQSGTALGLVGAVGVLGQIFDGMDEHFLAPY
jgi:hypothetical protein